MNEHAKSWEVPTTKYTQADVNYELGGWVSSSHVSGVRGVGHDGEPALEGGDLEERDVGVWHVVEGDGAVLPLGVVLGEAPLHVRHDLRRDGLLRDQVDALFFAARQGGELVSLNVLIIVMIF